MREAFDAKDCALRLPLIKTPSTVRLELLHKRTSLCKGTRNIHNPLLSNFTYTCTLIHTYNSPSILLPNILINLSTTSAMSSVEQQLQETAARNTELLRILSDTDYAPPALRQQEGYIKKLEAAILQNKADLRKLVSQREKEHKDHRKYSESVGRRFLYKASGQKDKFATKAGKEEREYFDALKAEHQAQDERDKLSGQMEEAQQGKSQLQPQASRHEQAQKDLDALYNAIFAGDTPAYPEEDEQEYATQAILGEYQQLESTLKTEEQVSQLLNQAQKTMAIAQYNVQDALGYSRVDMFGGGALWDLSTLFPSHTPL